MRKFFVFIISTAFVISSICFISCNNGRDDVGILKEIKKISNNPVTVDVLNDINVRTGDQKMMLGMLFYEVESDAINVWSNSLFYYKHTAKIEDQVISFYNDAYGPNLYGTIQNNEFETAKFHQAIYVNNGFTGCSIGKTNINEIYSRFGKPNERELDTKFVYYEDKKSITFFFKDGTLKNIMFTL